MNRMLAVTIRGAEQALAELDKQGQTPETLGRCAGELKMLLIAARGAADQLEEADDVIRGAGALLAVTAPRATHERPANDPRTPHGANRR